MAPTVSEIARVRKGGAVEAASPPVTVRSAGRGRKHSTSPAYDLMFKSIVQTLEDAYLHGTACTAAELWFRADLSGFAPKKRPNYTAFCTYLRHRVVKGELLSRPETVEERKVRRGKDTAPFNRFANLYAIPAADRVPEVTRQYDKYSPLTKEQKRFARANPAFRDGRAGTVMESVPETPVEPVEIPEMTTVKRGEAEPEQPETALPEASDEAVADPVVERKVLVMSTDGDAFADFRRELDSMKEQNEALRAAISHIAQALSTVMDPHHHTA